MVLRMEKISEIILEDDPDIVCLQEMTDTSYEYLSKLKSRYKYCLEPNLNTNINTIITTTPTNNTPLSPTPTNNTTLPPTTQINTSSTETSEAAIERNNRGINSLYYTLLTPGVAEEIVNLILDPSGNTAFDYSTNTQSNNIFNILSNFQRK